MLGKLLFVVVAGVWYVGGAGVWTFMRAGAAAPTAPALKRKTPDPVAMPSRKRVASVVSGRHKSRSAERWDRTIYGLPSRGAYVRHLRVRATAYSPISRGIEGGRYTATQRDGRSAHGVAVDPRLIRLGSRLWIPGYGHAVADDVGSAIRGHHVDVRVQDPDRMESWGVRDMMIYVLEEP